MGQMANILIERQQGSLPSNSEKNPRGEGKEHVKAFTLRSGRELATRGQPPIVREEETEVVDQFSPKDPMQGEQPQEEKPAKRSGKKKEIEKQARVDEPAIPIPYPQRLKKGKLKKQFTKFLDIFKKLHINIPFMDALENMPSYVKFMKKILASKKKWEQYGTITLTEECSSIL